MAIVAVRNVRTESLTQTFPSFLDLCESSQTWQAKLGKYRYCGCSNRGCWLLRILRKELDTNFSSFLGLCESKLNLARLTKNTAIVAVGCSGC